MNNEFEKKENNDINEQNVRNNSYNTAPENSIPQNNVSENFGADKNEPVEASFTEAKEVEPPVTAQEPGDTVYHYKKEEMPVFTDDFTSHETSIPNINEPVSSESSAQSSQNTNYDAFAGGTSYQSGTSNGYEWNNQKATNEKRKNKKSDGRGLRVFTGIMLGVFVLSFVTLTAMVATLVIDNNQNNIEIESNAASQQSYSPSASTSNYAAITNLPTDASALTIPQIAAKCSPSAVGILVEVNTSYNFGFFSQQGTATSVGSGFIFSEDGYIITNHHVIDGAKSIKVVLSDKTELEAELIGSDSISDIAVIKVEPTEGITLVPMEIGNSDDLVVGEPVVAIGCPAGIEYLGTVTDGIISAINRDVEITDSYGRIQKTMTLIQTNATINKGNSGGPLINSRGQVIGINTLKLTSEFEGIGFSIPMNGAMAIINQLIEHGEVIERTEEDFAYGSGQIGISGQAISEEEAEHYGIPQGVLVYQIDKTSSAAKAGLRRGDIITKYNGTDVKTVQDINDLKAKNRAGETVTVTVYRDSSDGKGETIDISFKLDAAS